MTLLFAGMTFAAAQTSRQLPSKEDLMSTNFNFGKDSAFRGALPKVDAKSFKASPNFKRPAINEMRDLADMQKGISKPESLCDDGYYWMGGEAWTVDTDGTVWVGGAGGNFYFGNCATPTTVHEEWWGDVPLRIRIHNSIAYVFCYFYTYVLDVSDPMSPSFLSYGPGYGYAEKDVIPSPDDSYLLMAYAGGGIDVFDLATMEYTWWVPSPEYAYYSMYVPEDTTSAGKTLIAGDLFAGTIDFWDISDLACSPPTYLGTIDDKIHAHEASNPADTGWNLYGVDANTGIVFYRYPYLYASSVPWQVYHPFLYYFTPYGDMQTVGQWVSVYRVEHINTPADSYFVKEQTDKYDIPRLGNSASIAQDAAVGGVFEANSQRRIALYEDQFANIIDDGYPTRPYDHPNDHQVFDGAFENGFGVAAMGSAGFRFFNAGFSETSHYWTGGYANGVVANGNYLYVPSGAAGLAILDNTDPTMPVTLAFVEPNDYFQYVWAVAVAPDGNTCYVTDYDYNVWVVDITDKHNPVVLSTVAPYLAGDYVYSLAMAGEYLVVGTGSTLELVDVTTVPSVPTQLDTRTLTGECWSVKTFEHPSYPGQVFIGAVTPTDYFTYRFTGGVFTDTGTIGGFSQLYDLAIAGQNAYVIDTNSQIFPIQMISSSPAIHFTLSTAGTMPLWIGYSWTHSYITKIDNSWLASSGDNTVYGYPAVFLVDIGTNPLAPAIVPAGQAGIMPFDYLYGLTYYNGYVYYGTDYFGIGALLLKPDFDMPNVIAGPTVTPVYGIMTAPSYLEGQVTLSIQVEDDTTAITSVVFKYYDGSAWRKIATKTNSTAAGVIGTYSHVWDINKWTYGAGNGPIRVEITDSGCNTTIIDTAEIYHLNLIPDYELVWDAGCNEPPVGGICTAAGAWTVCGDLCMTIWGYAYPGNLVSDGSVDDISQIAYAIDGGAWTLIDIPTDGPNPYYLCLDTTLLTDGSHTLTVRVTDDCSLQGFDDIYGQSSFTFTVDNLGPQPYITSPMAGDLVRGADIRVAAKMFAEMASRPVNLVRFYLDSTDTTTVGQIIATGTLVGSATTKDTNGEFSFQWDATTVPYGDHILVAVVWEDDVCSCGPYRTPLVSFNLVSYTAMAVSASGAPTSGNAPLSTVLTASVTGGQAPYTYAWAFGDSQTGTGNVVSHTYNTAGSYTATVTVTDNTAATATATVSITVNTSIVPPTISSVTKAGSPFRLHIYGTHFQAGCVVKINGTAVPFETFKDSTHVVAKKGSALKNMCPKGTAVQITVVNPDGGISNQFPYTR